MLPVRGLSDASMQAKLNTNSMKHPQKLSAEELITQSSYLPTTEKQQLPAGPSTPGFPTEP